jgi:hypothetical protein
VRKFRLGSLFSPAAFVVFAVLLSAAYFACDRLGWRVYTSVLSGTPPSTDGFSAASLWRNWVYVVLYFGHVLLSPILLLAALLLFVCQGRLIPRR